MDAREFASLGLYDPTDEHAALRLELLRYLVDLGASADDLIVYRDTLPGLASALAIRGGPLLTVEEVGQRSGLAVEEVGRLVRAAGFPDPEPGARVLTEGLAAIAANASAVADVMMRNGDVYGPVVNLAARAVKAAQPGEVLVTADLVDAAGLRTESRSLHRLKGVTGDIELRHVIRSRAPQRQPRGADERADRRGVPGVW
jgi:hypothetical protein